MTPVSPPTGRIPWDRLPASLRDRIADVSGSEVAEAATAPGGFSPGFAGVVAFADGSRRFVKAGDGGTNAETAELHRREAELSAALPSALAPRLDWTLEHDGWVVLALEVIDGRHPGDPWIDADLAAVLDAQASLAAQPVPDALEPLDGRVAEMLVGWSRLPRDEAIDALPDRLRPHLDRLLSWEGGETQRAADGHAIVHLDLRSDNILIDRDRVRFVDWPHAGRGSDLLDLVFLVPTVTLESGRDPVAVFEASPIAARVDPHDLAVLVSGWAGRLVWAGRQPDPPGIPQLREFQRRQAGVTLEWLTALLAGV